ncbi:ABC transporter ATP-binding protein [Actinocatenispora comari]|uniref:ABC-type quaternary amine transporter n=1 Tax=Actinocatenispora comari TaxID=2807577 RepID=A0A8J4EKG5_9ACTN|nr:ABC transporter ATP-binding protein [Actinocatenispora comari]GIL28177.1 polyamine-transporting ATPase [Actinocatenispora comari]
MDTPDAELRGVRKQYPGGARGVRDVSLRVERGEFFSLLGPSGCGKSTTLRILAGLEEPTAGEVLIRGESMARRPAHRRPTNLVFQRLALFPHLTVAENVAFGPRLRRGSRSETAATVAEMLELVGLSGLEKRYPAQLSGGQQQRVAIARALANRPAVLLLDEPLGSLDLKLRVQMQRALKHIQQESGTTFLYVTHDQVEALTMSDRMAVMNEGLIEQVGDPATLYRAPTTRFAATFLGDTNLFEGTHRDQVLDCAGIAVRVPGPGRFASVRPERVSVAAQLGDGYPNRFTGRLEEVVFQGASIRYQVRLPSGVAVTAERRDEATPALAVGTEVETGWPVDAAVMLDH